jgi:hypothetical protein
MSNERVKFSTSRRGIGTAEYDIAKKMMWKIDMTSAIETTMIIGDLTILIKSVGKNLQNHYHRIIYEGGDQRKDQKIYDASINERSI